MNTLLIALDSVGIDPLGHDRPESVYGESEFLFPRGQRGEVLALPDAPREGALVETDVTGGRESGAIECAITYASIFTGIDALGRHGLMQGLGLKDSQLEEMVAESNLFARFETACLANAMFPLHMAFLGSSYVEDTLPAVTREQVEAQISWRGEPLLLRGGEKRGFAELFTVAEINLNIFVHAAMESGVALRGWDDVRAGRALTGTLTHALERELDLSALGVEPLPARTPVEAAAVLAGLAGEHAFTFYKYQLADLVSHTGRVELAREVFAEIEAFLGALLEAVDPATRVVVTSDHGHLEQVAFGAGHPKSKVPTWYFGPDAAAVAEGLRHPTAIFEALTT